jgi:hypothetical protein
MIAAGKRHPAKLGQAGVVIPPAYPEVERSGKLAAGQLDGAALVSDFTQVEAWQSFV